MNFQLFFTILKKIQNLGKLKNLYEFFIFLKQDFILFSRIFRMNEFTVSHL